MLIKLTTIGKLKLITQEHLLAPQIQNSTQNCRNRLKKKKKKSCYTLPLLHLAPEVRVVHAVQEVPVRT